MKKFCLLTAGLIFLAFYLSGFPGSKAQNTFRSETPLPRSLFAAPSGALKPIAQTIKNYKSAGLVFERRDLFQAATKKTASDRQLNSIVSDGTILNLNKSIVREMLRGNVDFLTLSLPDGKGGALELELAKVNIFAPGFSVKTSKPVGAAETENTGAHYRGIIKGDDDSLAAVSIFQNEVMGFYSADGGGNSVLGRLAGNNPTDRHILYTEKDLKVSSDFYCETKDDGVTLPESLLREPEADALARCLRLYLEGNYDLFVNKGNVAETSAFITGMFNQSATIFANDGIPVSLSEIFVWNSPSPYDATTSQEALSQFRNTRVSFNGDIAHLITLNREFGGITNLNTLCDRTSSYSVGDIDPTYENVPTYSWTVYVITHEIGHILGSPHTHACAWNGNNTAIDSCGPFSGFPYEGNCGDAPLPSPGGGTIMSYCHRNVGISFNLGFGIQPRNVIVNRFNNAACLTDCSTNCSYAVSPAQSPIFSATGAVGSFNIATGSICPWEAIINVPSTLNAFTGFRRENIFPPLRDPTNLKTLPDAEAAPEVVFSNSTPIQIFDRLNNTTWVVPMRALPYPSDISVSGMNGTITQLKVNIYNLSHTAPDDIDILLQGPTGQTVIIMSDGGGNFSVENVNLTFEANGAELPNNGQIVSGSYRATNHPGNPALEGIQDLFQMPAPLQIQYSSNLSDFMASAPNGRWRLFIIDDESPNTGTVNSGWGLEIRTTGGSNNWLSIQSAPTGVGSGAVTYQVEENTGQSPRTGNIWIRGQLYTVRQAGTASAPNRTPFDFDGDRKSDLSIYRRSNGYWYINNSSNNAFKAVQFGTDGDLLAPEDFDGDGKTDISVFRPATGSWYRLNSSDNSFAAVQFGADGDMPAPGDYDGDRKSELALFRPAVGTWYLLNLVTNQFTGVQFGANGDKPVAADYDGDRKTDYGVYRPGDGTWYLLRSRDGFTAVQFGIATDKPVFGDYDGDGKSDPAVYRDGVWYQLQSSQGFKAIQFGIATDLPSQADYDGDGKTDVAVYRDNTWYLLLSTQGFIAAQFGATGDKPVPHSFVQ